VKLLRRLVVGLLLFIGLNIYGLEEEKKWVEQALGSWNLGLLEEAVDALDTQAKSSPQDVKLAYWQSVAAFHLLLMTENPSNEQIEPTLETVKRAYQLNKNHPEINAMLCVLYGMRIKEKQVRSVWLGPRLMSHSKKALALPENPRALYLVATCRYYSGQEKKDFEETLRLLTRAEALFKAESQIPTDKEPRWGAAGCAKFKKMTLDKLGDFK
jgi:tetratricopeptide (TPR) repeat protein